MQLYETIYIVKPDLDSKSLKGLEEKYENLLKLNKAIIEYKENWGLRNLAYPIKKNVKGIYQNLYFESNGKAIKEIEYFERYNDKVIKFLSIKLKKLPKEDSQLKSNK